MAAVSRPWASNPGNSRSNSPSCGVSTSSRSRQENRSAGRSRNRVRASASMTSAAPVRARAATLTAVASVSPAAGPITTASIGWAREANCSPLEKLASITASSVGARTGAASGGQKTFTSPAPVLKPARAASRAAPVDRAPPDTTPSRPRTCLWASGPGQGSRLRHVMGSLIGLMIEFRSRMASTHENCLPYCAMQCPFTPRASDQPGSRLGTRHEED